LAASGCNAALVIPFDQGFASRSGEDFIRELAAGAAPLRSVSVGEGFSFGNRRSGNVPLLHTLGAELGFVTQVAPPFSFRGEIVSSSRIRETLRAGRLSEVAELLGRPYALAGIVQPGAQLARQLGFPTANVAVDGLELPPAGVYAAWVQVLRTGNRYPAVLNLGLRPTVTPGETQPRLEAHLLDFSGDLYGQEIEVEFASQLRPELTFSGLDALSRQIADDVVQARAFHGI
jgi:riboflavin kinase/FMN adenylyltransferase